VDARKRSFSKEARSFLFSRLIRSARIPTSFASSETGRESQEEAKAPTTEAQTRARRGLGTERAVGEDECGIGDGPSVVLVS